MSNNNVSSQAASTVNTVKANVAKTNGGKPNATSKDSTNLLTISTDLMNLKSVSLREFQTEVGNLLRDGATPEEVKRVVDLHCKGLVEEFAKSLKVRSDAAVSLSKMPQNTTAKGGGFDKNTAITAFFLPESKSVAMDRIKKCLGALLGK